MLNLEIERSTPDDPKARALIEELSLDLVKKTGRDGRDSFATSDVASPRSVFLIATLNGNAAGCGALRPLNEKICEIKRMYARIKGAGIGAQILSELEKCAIEFGYERAWLETGIENKAAIRFYEQNGYRICENFGKYKGRPECVCFEKVFGQ